MKKTKQYAIVSPAADEEKTIEAFTLELLDTIKELNIKATIFFIVDKASTSETIAILRKLAKNHKEVVVIYEANDKHVVDAYMRGLTEALKRNYDYAIDMDCGYSHLPSELYKIVDALEEGNDCVFGIRPLNSPKYKVPLSRRIYSFGGTVLSNFLLGMKYRDTTSGFNGYTYTALKNILSKPILSSGNFWHVEMRYRAKKFTYKEVSITYTSPSNRVKPKTIMNSFSVLMLLTKERFFGTT